MEQVELPKGTQGVSESDTSNNRGLDQFRNSLTKEDFKTIDNQSNSLSVKDLPAVQTDISFASQESSDQSINFDPVIPAWLDSSDGTQDKSGGTSGDKPIDPTKVDPVKDKSEKPADTQTKELREKLETLSAQIAKTVPKKSEDNSKAPYEGLMNNYSDIQRMWEMSNKLPGEPMTTMESSMNKALKDKGFQVKLHKSDEPGAPKVPWMNHVAAYIAIDPKGSGAADMVGRGIIGLGTKPRAMKSKPN